MPKNRQGRINDEVRAALADALRNIKDPRVSGLVSIVRCEVTPDMRYCKTFVSVLGSDEERKNVIKGLKSAAGWLRRELAMRVSLRYTPEIVIVSDDSISYGARINEIIHSFENKPSVGPSPSDCSDGSDKS